MSRIPSRFVPPCVLVAVALASVPAFAAGPTFVVERRVSIPSERFREVHWAPNGGKLAALTFRTVAIVDAASGEFDTLAVPAIEHLAWSPTGEWIAVRSVPGARASGRERRDRVFLISASEPARDQRLRTIVDTVLVRPEMRHPVLWKGDALLSTMQDSAWVDVRLAPEAAPKPGLAGYWVAPPAFQGSAERVYVGAVGADGTFETREIPPPPSTMMDSRIDPAHPISRGWSPVRMTPGGRLMLVTAREKDGIMYLILGADGTPQSRFTDGLNPSDLSDDGKWILAQSEVVASQQALSSELFLVRVADARAFALTGTVRVTETDAAFEPGARRIACIDQADGALLIGRIEGFPEGD